MRDSGAVEKSASVADERAWRYLQRESGTTRPKELHRVDLAQHWS
jgi:hypothetical protein